MAASVSATAGTPEGRFWRSRRTNGTHLSVACITGNSTVSVGSGRVGMVLWHRPGPGLPTGAEGVEAGGSAGIRMGPPLHAVAPVSSKPQAETALGVLALRAVLESPP